jgi:hypothetical protein
VQRCFQIFGNVGSEINEIRVNFGVLLFLSTLL